MRRGLINGIVDHSKNMQLIRNEEFISNIMRRYPFDKASNKQISFHEYGLALQYMFENVSESQWPAIMGRLNRKLIKVVQHFNSIESPYK